MKERSEGKKERVNMAEKSCIKRQSFLSYLKLTLCNPQQDKK